MDISTHQPVAPTAAQIARQVEWEMIGVRRAVAAFRETSDKAEASGRGHETRYGQALLRRIAPRMIEAVETAHAESIESIAGRGAPAAWIPVVTALSPTVTAAITASVCTAAALLPVGMTGRTVPSVAYGICRALRDQIELRDWQAQMEERRKIARELDEPGPDLLSLFRLTYPAATARQWRAWAKKVEAMKFTGWTRAQREHGGAKLIRMLCDSSPGVFKVETVMEQGKTKNVLSLSDEVADKIVADKQILEVATPRLLPMLVPPNDWQ